LFFAGIASLVGYTLWLYGVDLVLQWWASSVLTSRHGADNPLAEAFRLGLAQGHQNMRVMARLLAFFRLARRRVNVHVRHHALVRKLLAHEIGHQPFALLVGEFVQQGIKRAL
jgi:hypothetical protein